MRILIAEDDSVSRRLLELTLVKWGYDIVSAVDGLQAWAELQKENAPHLAILDWMMPGLDGIDVCRKVRENPSTRGLYIILLTARRNKTDIVAGLEAGSDDYLIKPFDRDELHARLRVGVRVVELQRHLDDRVKELQKALTEIRQLHGMLPICSHCKRIRDDKNYWQQVETYISKHTEARFSHSICPECFDRVIKPELEELIG